MNLAPVATVQRVTAEYYMVPLRVITNYEMSPSAIRARQVSAFLAHTLLGQGTFRLAPRFKRDHATIRHSITRVTERMREDAELREDIAILSEKLVGGPVDNHVKEQITANHAPERGKEHSGNGQEERLVA